MTATDTSKQQNRELFNSQRGKYMEGELSHDAFYLWLADFIGASASMVPYPIERIRASIDPHLNDLPLAKWDSQDYIIRQLACRKGLAWSLGDTVCVLKALARRTVAT